MGELTGETWPLSLGDMTMGEAHSMLFRCSGMLEPGLLSRTQATGSGAMVPTSSRLVVVDSSLVESAMPNGAVAETKASQTYKEGQKRRNRPGGGRRTAKGL